MPGIIAQPGGIISGMLVPSKWVMRTLVAGATAMVILGGFGLYWQGLASDWLAYYAAGHFLLDGRLAQVYDLPILQAWQASIIGQQITPFLYAPVYSLPFASLALLTPWAARWAWLAIGIIAGLAAARLSTRWSGLSFPVSMVALLAFPPFAFSLAVGQISPITLLIFAGVTVLEWAKRRDASSGLLAGLALYKPQQLIPLVVYWLASRRWRSLLGFAGAAVLIGLVSYLISPQSMTAYLALSRSFFSLAKSTTASGANISLYAISPWVGLLTLAGVLVLLVVISVRRPDSRYLAAVLWLAPVLAAPYIVIYDMLLVALPISILAPALRKDRLLQAGVILVWLAAFLAPFVVATRPVTWAVLVLYALCFRKALQDRPEIRLLESHDVIESDH